MDSPVAYPDSPLDQDDIAYPCKGCGEVCNTQFQEEVLKLTSHRGRFWKRAKHSNLVRNMISNLNLNFTDRRNQLEIGGILIAFAVIPVVLCSTPMRTSSSSATGL